jgi:hypothetical protein
MLEQLETLQVPANVLYGKDHLVKCSHVRNHFTWREQELRKLRQVKVGRAGAALALVAPGRLPGATGQIIPEG